MKKNSGLTTVELIFAVGIGSFLTATVGFVVLQAGGAVGTLKTTSALTSTLDDIVSTINADDAWLRTLEAGRNTGSFSAGAMDCLVDGTHCTIDGAANSAPISDKSFALVNARDQVTFNSIAGANGLTQNGEKCAAFDAVNGNDQCPFRFQMNWSAVCTPPTCINPLVLIKINLQYSPASKKARINSENYSVKTLYRLPLIRSNPPACLSGFAAFQYTGGWQTFTQPANCYSVVIKAWGAGGGGGPTHSSGGPAAAGGSGGFVQTTLPTLPGQQISVLVGAGGLGGYVPGGVIGDVCGGGGGGMSAASRADLGYVVIAGGGGGAGGAVAGNGGPGGPGGGINGVTEIFGGSGATQSGPGAGAPPGGGGGGSGNPGGSFFGGDALHSSYACATAPPIGGGGSGWWGGGGGGGLFGGGGGTFAFTGGYGDSGGGGGSGFALGTSQVFLTGSGATPPATGDPFYQSPAGVGGAASPTTGVAGPGQAGGNGRVVIQY